MAVILLLVIPGWTNDMSPTNFNDGELDIWIIKLDQSGNLQWDKYFGGSNSEAATSIQQTIDGGYIIGGHSESNDGDVGGNNGFYDYWIIKLDGSGNLFWERNYRGSGYDYANSIQQTSDGGYIVAGQSSGNAWIVKLDESGNLVWEQSYDGSNGDVTIQLTNDGGYVFAGSFYTNPFNDFWVVKLSGTETPDFSQPPTVGTFECSD